MPLLSSIAGGSHVTSTEEESRMDKERLKGGAEGARYTQKSKSQEDLRTHPLSLDYTIGSLSNYVVPDSSVVTE